MIRVESLEKAFDGQVVLRELSLEVKRGELVALIGPSGSGKSTLLRCLNGLEAFDRGQIEILNEQLSARVSDEDKLNRLRRKVAMVFQSFNLFPHLTVEQNLMLAPSVLGLEAVRGQALSMLEKVGLVEHATKKPNQLSGGQQQRAAIARALVMQPDVILYDEPTSALDPALVHEVHEVMKRLKTDGLTQVVVTHEMDFARAVADRVYVLDRGQVVESGATADVLVSPKHATTKGLLKKLFSVVAPAFLSLAVLGGFAEVGVASPELRWAADAESGAPFVFKDPRAPQNLIGFETELASALAEKMGRRSRPIQNNWEGLVEGLKGRNYDLAINGIEITDERSRVVSFSKPYYVTHLVLTVRQDNKTILKLSDLAGKRVGTLAASLAHRTLSEQSEPMEVVSYSEELHAYNDLAMGRIEAVLLDEPIAKYYAGPNGKLKTLQEKIGRIEYGIAMRKEDGPMQASVALALDELIREGRVEQILKRWALWNEPTAATFQVPYSAPTATPAYDDFLTELRREHGWSAKARRYVSFLPILGRGALLTLAVSFVGMAIAVVFGMVTALTKLYGAHWARRLASLYVEIFRGTPLLIQLFLLFYGLPHVGIQMHPFVAAVVGLGLNYGACEAEIYRAGILAIPKTQYEAARALGLSHWQSLRHVILPQAFRIALPPSTNDFIALLKDSSLVSVITMVELTAAYSQLASTYFDYLGIGLITAAIYFLIGWPFVKVSRRLEQKAIH